MTLADQLARFHRIVTGDDPAGRAAGLVEGGRVDEATRMGVYAYAYTARLGDVLAGDYPKLARTHPDFRGLVVPYLRAFPPRAPSLREAGAHVASFLASRGEPPWSVDLARLERARTEAFDRGSDPTPLSRGALEDFGPEEFPSLPLRLVPSAMQLELSTNADDLWDAIEDGRDPPPPADGARAVLVWRRDFTVIHRTLEPDEARVVSTLTAGSTFAAACELLVDDPEAVSRALTLLVRWLDAGVLVTTR